MLRFDEEVFILDELDSSSPKKKTENLRRSIDSPSKAEDKKIPKQTFNVTEKNCCKFCLKYFPRLDQLNAHILSKHLSNLRKQWKI